MIQDKMYLINKLFNDETIITVWDGAKEKYYISVVDIVGVISESKDGRKYWNKLKQRLKEESLRDNMDSIELMICEKKQLKDWQQNTDLMV